jgi:endonuclease I
MKKFLLTAFGSALLVLGSIAQTSLPTTWGFNTATLPTGWTDFNANSTVTPTYYSASGNPAPAYKFDYTADKLTIFFASTPGTLTYDIAGNSFAGGTFIVEESVNGTTWTTLHTYTTLSAGTYTPSSDSPNSASRYIRFNYLNKSTGNVGLDNVSIAQGFSTTQQISVKQGTTTIVNGGTYSLSSPVSTNTPTTFVIQNLGTANTLNISGVTITGPNAADYSVSSFPATVAASSNGNMVIDFTPSASGSRIAAINIANNDPTGNPYIINMYGVGGTLATEPTAQATAFSFTNVKSYHLNASFTAASPAPEGYIVLRRKGAAITDVPVDGVVYQRGDIIGNSKVMYSSSATAFYPNEIVANTTYYYAVFTYNGPGAFRNYNTASPLTGSVTSASSMQPATYYSASVNTSHSTFITELHSKINPHTMQFYSNYGSLMVSKFYARDTTGNQRVVTCVYSGLNKVYTEPFDFTTNDFSREHTYCNSWQPTTNNNTPDNTNLPEYNDYHMLMPTNQTNVNAVRSNYPLGEVVGTPLAASYLGDKIGNDSHGHKVFEPRDSDKGDAARAMMYECIAYTGVPYSGPPNTNCTYGGSWSLPSYISSTIPYGQDQNVLKKWHYQDPPDNFEIARNDYVDSLQGNRNPFIDSVQFACYIDFSNMTKIASPLVPCSAVGINEEEGSNNDMIMLYPNPNNGNFVLTYITDKTQELSLKMFDLVGNVVYTEETKVIIGYNPIEMNIQNLSKGIYIFEMVTPKGRKTEKLVIE